MQIALRKLQIRSKFPSQYWKAENGVAPSRLGRPLNINCTPHSQAKGSREETIGGKSLEITITTPPNS